LTDYLQAGGKVVARGAVQKGEALRHGVTLGMFSACEGLACGQLLRRARAKKKNRARENESSCDSLRQPSRRRGNFREVTCFDVGKLLPRNR